MKAVCLRCDSGHADCYTHVFVHSSSAITIAVAERPVQTAARRECAADDYSNTCMLTCAPRWCACCLGVNRPYSYCASSMLSPRQNKLGGSGTIAQPQPNLSLSYPQFSLLYAFFCRSTLARASLSLRTSWKQRPYARKNTHLTMQVK
jgi:hypothetical protein